MLFKSLVLALALVPAVATTATGNQARQRHLQKNTMLNDNTPNGNNGKGGGNNGGSGGEGGGDGGNGNDPDKLNDNTPNGNNGKKPNKVTSSNNKLAGGGGDPHIKRWNGRRFAFHGECDLLLLHTANFADNLGLDLHIRTTVKDFYSFIETAALRIGDSVLEVTMGQMMLDGVEFTDADLPLAISGFTINAPYQDEKAMVYKVDLNNGDAIMFRMYKFFLSVDVAGNSRPDFADSVGLLGEYETGDMLGRDGVTVVEDPITFGMEWQVQGEEPRLFHDMEREPQLPNAICNMPLVTGRRRLEGVPPELMTEAKKACAHKSNEDFEFCVGDILLTGDVGMAGAW